MLLLKASFWHLRTLVMGVSQIALVVGVRWVSPARIYTEACLVTYVLVVLDLLLKLCDASLPIVLTVRCFPQSVVPPFNSFLAFRVENNSSRPFSRSKKTRCCCFD